MDLAKFCNALPATLSYLYRRSSDHSGTSVRTIVDCLEFNLVTSGATAADAERRMDCLVVSYVVRAFLKDNLAAISNRKPDPAALALFWANSPKPAGALLLPLSEEARKLLARMEAMVEAKDHTCDTDGEMSEAFGVQFKIPKTRAAA